MGDKFIKFKDYFRLDGESLLAIKDDYAGAFKPERPGPGLVTGFPNTPGNSPAGETGTGLFVRMAATHAGIIINNRMYLPNKMKDGTDSFVKPYPKPVQLHHDDLADPIGRIVEASYVDTSKAVLDMLEVKKGTFQNALTIKNSLEDMVSGRMPLMTVVDTLNMLVKDGITETDGYTGLGHILIRLHITDQLAVQKFLDSRYLTGSVGARTDAAICSVCKQDWVENGFCDHEPGKVYDGIACFIITGNLSYGEYSIVNHPADVYSQVMELVSDSGTQVKEFANIENKRTIYQIPLYVVDFKKEDKKMSDAISKDAVVAPAPSPETAVADQVPSAAPVVAPTDTATVPVEAPAAVPETPAPVAAEVKNAEENVTLPTEPVAQPTVLEILLQKVIDGSALTEEESDKLYEEMMAEEIADAKLSTEKRKALSSSTFCGPNRSFPVPDCAHVTAARRLIGRYKGPGDKSKILACVSRKAKSLGCDSKGKDSLPVDFKPEAIINVDKYTKEQVEALVAYANKHLGVEKDEACVLELQKENELLLSEIVNLETKVGELRDEMEVLKIKYEASLNDIHTSQDRLIGINAQIRDIKVKYLQLLSTVVEKKERELKDFDNLQEEILNSEIIKYQGLVDIKEISLKLNDGMARVPNGEKLEDPTIKQELKDKKTTLSVKDMEAIQLKYTSLLFQKGADAAQAYIKSLQQQGIIPGQK